MKNQRIDKYCELPPKILGMLVCNEPGSAYTPSTRATIGPPHIPT